MAIDPPDDIELELVEGTDDLVLPGVGRVPTDLDALEFAFDGELWYWRGPAPYHFITVPPDAARAIGRVAAEITYGWGMIPASVRIGSSAWETALFAKDGGYVIPIKDAFRKAERIELGDMVAVRLGIRR
jgi:Domain of unknown function (DUF1905)